MKVKQMVKGKPSNSNTEKKRIWSMLRRSNQMNENASIKVIVDEVWNSYDVNNNGWLEKSEMKKFVKEFMPEMK